MMQCLLFFFVQVGYEDFFNVVFGDQVGYVQVDIIQAVFFFQFNGNGEYVVVVV